MVANQRLHSADCHCHLLSDDVANTPAVQVSRCCNIRHIIHFLITMWLWPLQFDLGMLGNRS